MVIGNGIAGGVGKCSILVILRTGRFICRRFYRPSGETWAKLRRSCNSCLAQLIARVSCSCL